MFAFEPLSDPNRIKAAQHMRSYQRWERLTIALNGAANWVTDGIEAQLPTSSSATPAMRCVFGSDTQWLTIIGVHYRCDCGTGAHFNRSSLHCPIDRLLANDSNDRYTTKSVLHCINNKFQCVSTIESILRFNHIQSQFKRNSAHVVSDI